jgi:hypothetical protein
MRFSAIAITGIALMSAAWASDAFFGDWKLNPSKSTSSDGRVAKDGRALIEPDNSGGYLQISETVFAEGPALRFNSRMQFDGTKGDGTFEDHPVQYVSKRIDGNAFEISIRELKAEQAGQSIRVSVAPEDRTLTMVWLNGSSAPLRKLVYEKAPEGPLMAVGKTLDHAFGPAAVFEYRVHLKSGEYCQGKVEQKDGSVNIASYGPDGARLHSYGGPPTGSKTFALEAPVEGTYRIVLRSPPKPATSYTITIDKILPPGDWPHGEPAKEKFTSPRLASLRKELEAGNSSAVASFWQEVEKQGTPLIEPLKDNTTDNLVTFLWRATTETHNVFIIWFPYAAAKPDDYTMVRLANTDVWYRTVKIRRGARFAYQLSPNDSLTFDQPSPSRMATERI